MKEDLKMRIMIIMTTLSSGGAERVVSNYANWVVENAKSEVDLILFGELKTIYEINSKVKIHEAKIFGGGINIIKRYNYLKKKMKEIKPDIIFSPFHKEFLYGVITSSKDSVKIFSERASILRVSRISKMLRCLSARLSSGIIFQTERAKSRYPKWTIKNEVAIISNSVSDAAVKESKKNFQKEKRIISVGRLDFQKGFDVLIKAFKNIVDDYPEYKLVIYGEGSERSNLENLIKSLKLENKVQLLGVSKEAVLEIAKSELFVLSSRYEGMPNVLIEAMAVGTAVIATDCEAGPSELINNYKNGILIPVDDVKTLSEKIKEVLKNKELRNKLSNNAKKILETNSQDIIYQKYYDYMKKVFISKRNYVKISNLRKRIFFHYSRTNLFNKISDEKYLPMMYKYSLSRKLDLKNPRTFNEKLQWLKLYDRNPNYPIMASKYEAKKYIANIIGEEYVIPTLGIYDKFEDIDFNKLPLKFVIKCTHDSGGLVICRDKKSLDINSAKEKIEKSLKTNYYLKGGREWCYKDIKPQIIIEKYMEDDNKEAGLIDYKFYCFNGKPEFLYVDVPVGKGSHTSSITFFDMNYQREKFHRVDFRVANKNPKKPLNFEKMKEIATILSKNIPFLRVDLYEINGHIYCGELTFYPTSGMCLYEPIEYDYYIGELLDLGGVKSNEK